MFNGRGSDETTSEPGHVTRARLRAADTGRLFRAGSATEWHPTAEIVETAYRSGLRAAAEARTVLEGARGAGVG